jgi:hypothetical protein
MEMRTIQSLTSGMTRRKITSLKRNEAKARIEEYGEVEHELSKISSVYSIKNFCECFIGAVNIATTYRADINKVEECHKVLERDSQRTIKEVEHWYTDCQGYPGCHYATWCSNCCTSNDATTMS